jgi:hypothetical protein
MVIGVVGAAAAAAATQYSAAVPLATPGAAYPAGGMAQTGGTAGLITICSCCCFSDVGVELFDFFLPLLPPHSLPLWPASVVVCPSKDKNCVIYSTTNHHISDNIIICHEWSLQN